jgi:predicted dinucleotide-binding enzyme
VVLSPRHGQRVLFRDAGYEPVRVGALDMAAAQERMIEAIIGIADQMGRFVYRMAPPAELL